MPTSVHRTPKETRLELELHQNCFLTKIWKALERVLPPQKPGIIKINIRATHGLAFSIVQEPPQIAQYIYREYNLFDEHLCTPPFTPIPTLKSHRGSSETQIYPPCCKPYAALTILNNIPQYMSRILIPYPFVDQRPRVLIGSRFGGYGFEV